MPWKSETELATLIDKRQHEFASLMDSSVPTEEHAEAVLTVMVELQELKNELEFVRDNRPDEPDSLVRSPSNRCPISTQMPSLSLNRRQRREKCKGTSTSPWFL